MPGTSQIPFSLTRAFEGYTREEWISHSTTYRLSSTHLALFYRVKNILPRELQLALRRLLIARQGRPSFPTWPLDRSVGQLLQFYARCLLIAAGRTESEFIWFWPEHYSAALILSHDVEGPEGIRLALELADLEEELGFRSSFNFGAWYEIDPGVLDELRGRGFEIGSHGPRARPIPVLLTGGVQQPARRTAAGGRAAWRSGLPVPGDPPQPRVACRSSIPVRLHGPEL